MSPSPASNPLDVVLGQLYETHVCARSEPCLAECRFKLWIPEDLPAVRSLLVINRRGAGKHLFYQDTEWRAMAARNRVAMMYCEFEALEVRENGYGAAILQACDQFAAELGRPELRSAPFLLWGHSMGGRVAQDFVRFVPARVLAFLIALRGDPSAEPFMREEPAAMRVPALYLMGDRDSTPDDIREHFRRARANGSPRAWIRLPGQAHWPAGMDFEKDETTAQAWRAWMANDVVIPWTEAMIRLRMPAHTDLRRGALELRELELAGGWLGDPQAGQTAPHDQFRGDPADASWFPNEEVARAWARFSFPENDRADPAT